VVTGWVCAKRSFKNTYFLFFIGAASDDKIPNNKSEWSNQDLKLVLERSLQAQLVNSLNQKRKQDQTNIQHLVHSASLLQDRSNLMPMSRLE
jgi:hypothetical protein